MKKKKKNMVCVHEASYGKSATLIVLLLFSSFIFPGDISVQSVDIAFEQISIEQGLSQGTAFCILQDKQGFIWVGTQNGLNRYDGHTFKIYNHDPRDSESLSHDYVISIYEELPGILWIGTDGGGLNKFDQKTGKFSHFKNDPNNPKTLSNDNVRAIHKDRSGTLWIGTDEGVNRFDHKANKCNRYLINERINSILPDSYGILWVGTDRGLYYYNQEDSKFIEVKFKKNLEEKEAFSQKIKVIYEAEDKDGALWIGTDSGLYKFILEQDAIIHDMKEIARNSFKLKDKQISSICSDSWGNLWVGTKNNGLFIFDPKEKKLIHHANKQSKPGSLSNNLIRSIYEDRYGLVWIGTDGGGLYKFDPRRKKFNLYRNSDGLSDDDVMAICKGKNGVIWIGTWGGGGVNKFEPEKAKNKFHHYPIPYTASKNPSRNQIRAVCEDRSGVLWVGTDNAGLYNFKPEEEKFELYKNNHIEVEEKILCIYVDEENVLWIGCMDGGLIRIDNDRKTVTRYKNKPGYPNSLSNNKVFSIFGDSTGVLWIGTGGGLNKFDKEKGLFTRYQPEPGKPDSLSHNFILSIYKDGAGTLWIGTNGGGINKFDSAKEIFTAYSNQDGLPANVIYAILEDDDGNLWLSTNKGLSRFNPKSKVFRNYTVRDGLQGYEFNRRVACKTDSGEMFFGGRNGLNRFDPKELRKKEIKKSPPVVITSFKKLGQEVKLNPSITYRDCLKLSYKDDFISVEFAALSFSDPGKNQYAYKLEPNDKDNKDDKDWIYLGNKHDVDLIHLEPGEYILKVKGSNSDSAWNETGAKIKIMVTPPFTQTIWFYICLAIFLSSGILGFVRWRISNIKNTNKRLQEEINKRQEAQEELREKEELYRKLIETSPDAITLYDFDVENGKTVMFNQQFAVLLGYTNEAEMLAEVKNVFDIIDERDREKAHNSIKEIIKETAVNKNTEYTLIAKDGTPISVEINTSLIKDTDGNPRYLLSIARDIRERKEAEKKEKLHRGKLIQLDRMVSLGRLVSGVAHELNNPVASIKMNAEIFDRVWKDVVPVLDRYYRDKEDFSLAGIPYLDAKKRLEELIIGFMEGSQRVEKIIHDLREFSRPSDHSTGQPIDINKVIQSSIGLTENLIKKSTKNFAVHLAKSLPPIMGNFQKLEQVFINLIQNACQALPDNNKYISIKSNYNKENKHVVVTVKDGGEGIDEKDLKYITDPFFTSRRDQGGTGLGLSISMQIIQEHKGSMKFQSVKGKGTTVSVSLPLNE